MIPMELSSILEKKVNEFVRAGTVLEFAPDREARAVKFLKAQFVDKLNYRTLFEGSYLTTGGPAVP